MLGIFGFILLFGIILILFWGKVSPVVAFVGLPFIFALFLGFSPIEIGHFIYTGVGTTVGTAMIFIFSIPFFYMMNEVGVFSPFVNFLVKFADGKMVRVTIFTVLLTIIAHMDGAGATTALICVPALLPIYKKMNMRPHVLVFLIAMSAGIMNLIPWSGSMLRAAAAVDLNPSEVWLSLIPIQALGLILSLAMAIFFGIREKKFTETAIEWYNKNQPTKSSETGKNAEQLPKWKMYVNIAMILIVIALLIWGEIAVSVVFMIATTFALFVNYPGMKEQNALLDRAASGILTVVTVLLAAGALIGILEYSGMLSEMGELLLSLIPQGAGNYYNLIVGFMAGPVAVVFGTDSYFFGLLPIVSTVGEALGFPPVTSAKLLLIGHNSTVFVSPFTPAMFLLIGLAGVDLKEHLRFSLPWAIPISWVYVTFGFILGII